MTAITTTSTKPRSNRTVSAAFDDPELPEVEAEPEFVDPGPEPVAPESWTVTANIGALVPELEIEDVNDAE